MTSRNKREGWYSGHWGTMPDCKRYNRPKHHRTFRYVASLEGFAAWNKYRAKLGKPAIKERPQPW
jgi:hypothetical protein